jgi:hypothetical protein
MSDAALIAALSEPGEYRPGNRAEAEALAAALAALGADHAELMTHLAWNDAGGAEDCFRRIVDRVKLAAPRMRAYVGSAP